MAMPDGDEGSHESPLRCPRPVSADLRLLRAVLSRELDGGSEDSLVTGGLDGLLRLQARDEQPGAPVLRMVAALPAEGYRSLDRQARTTWLRRALATIRRGEALERDLPSVPATGRHDPGRRADGPGGAAANTGGRHDGEAGPDTAKRGGGVRGRKPNGTSTSHRAVDRPRSDAPPGTDELGLQLPIARAGTRLGKANLARLEKLGIRTVWDALHHLPARHNDFSQTAAINRLRIGREQTVRGTIATAREVRMGRGGRMRSTEATVVDDSGAAVRVTWFNQPYLAKSLRPGTAVALAGKVTIYRGRPTFQNPEFERLELNTDGHHTGRIVPVYPLTRGLPQRTLREMIARLLERYGDRIPDPLPQSIRRRHRLLDLVEAISQIHFPDSQEQIDGARHRFAFDELLAVQIGVQTLKRQWQESGEAAQVQDGSLANQVLADLPFSLTEAQTRVLSEIRGDLARSVPMARLLEGDVGSGKTVVALAAMLDLVAAGYQTVLMAPTEILAEQHFQTLCRLLAGEPEPALNGLVQLPDLTTAIVLLTGSTRSRERRSALDAIRTGKAQIIVGTQALIQEGVDYDRLGLAVVDEQHRFGVRQRGELRKRAAANLAGGTVPHLLVMSATPIPRSLALTLFGDLDLSVIDELPEGRTPIETRWLPPEERGQAFQHLRQEVAVGRQAFVICPLVEDSDAVQSRAATDEYERLRTEELPELADRIALLHGRMSSRAKDKAMRSFASGESAVLVSTAVVEVGIDVPNATLMLIEDADRFGLAQLHQFRGRVGRGEHHSRCYLLSDDPSEDARERLAVMERTTDGFALAQADLELRGPGDLYGTTQSGMPQLQVAALLNPRLIDATRREAELLLTADPELSRLEHQPLRYAIAQRAGSVVDEEH